MDSKVNPSQWDIGISLTDSDISSHNRFLLLYNIDKDKNIFGSLWAPIQLLGAVLLNTGRIISVKPPLSSGEIKEFPSDIHDKDTIIASLSNFNRSEAAIYSTLGRGLMTLEDFISKALILVLRIDGNLLPWVLSTSIILKDRAPTKEISKIIDRELRDKGKVPFEFKGRGWNDITPKLLIYFQSIPITIREKVPIDRIDAKDSDIITLLSKECNKYVPGGATDFLRKVVKSGEYTWIFNALVGNDLKQTSLFDDYLKDLVQIENTELLQYAPDFSKPVPYIFNHEQFMKFPLLHAKEPEGMYAKKEPFSSMINSYPLPVEYSRTESYYPVFKIEDIPLDDCVLTGKFVGLGYSQSRLGISWPSESLPAYYIVPILQEGETEEGFTRDILTRSISLNVKDFNMSRDERSPALKIDAEINGIRRIFEVVRGNALHIAYMGDLKNIEGLVDRQLEAIRKAKVMGVVKMPLGDGIFCIFDRFLVNRPLLIYPTTLIEIFRSSHPLERIAVKRLPGSENYQFLITASYMSEILTRRQRQTKSSTPNSYYNPRKGIDRSELYEPLSSIFTDKEYSFAPRYPVKDSLYPELQSGSFGLGYKYGKEYYFGPFFAPASIVERGIWGISDEREIENLPRLGRGPKVRSDPR